MSKINKYGESKIVNNFTRADEVSVSPDTKEAVESIATAHLAAGNTSEAVIAFDVVRKFQTQNDITTFLKVQAENSAKQTALLEEMAKKK